MKHRALGAAFWGFLVGITHIPDAMRLVLLAFLLVYVLAIDIVEDSK